MTTEQSIYDPHAQIEAVGLYYDTDVESWRLWTVGNVDECTREIENLTQRLPNADVRIYEVNLR